MTKTLRVRWPFDPTEKSPRRRALLLGLSAALLFAAAVCLGLMSLYFATLYFVKVRFFTYFAFPALIALNVVPVVLLAAVLWLLTNRAWLAFLLDWVLTLGLTFISFFKVVVRDDPLSFEDIAYAGEAAGVVGNYDLSIPKLFFVAVAICIAGTLVLLLFARARLGKPFLRVWCAVCLLALSLVGLRTVYFSEPLYDSFQNNRYFNLWQPAEDFASRGFVYPFLHSVKAALPESPEGYSAKKAETLLAEAGDDPIPAGQRVNVIAVMLESFSDLGALNYTNDPYVLLRALEQQSIHGSMISDTLGGGTCNSERSFLTGSLYPQPDYRHATWSYVRYFASQGYQTAGGHPGFAWYYNRETVNRNLGFESYDFNENYYDAFCEEEHAPDAVFFPALLERYQARDRSVPWFSYSLTYQGHGPYSSEALTWGEEYLSHDGVSDATYYTVNHYLGGAADTLQHLTAFLRELEQDAEPVVVVLFGDHKPTLGSSNACYDELGISLERATAEGFENYYSTPYLIWGNDAAKTALGKDLMGEGPTVGPYFLMNVLFEACGWDGPAFLKVSNALRQKAEVVHSTGVYLSDGKLCRELPDDAAERSFRIVQYYLRKKASRNAAPAAE